MITDPFAVSIENDFEVFDNLETVTYYRRTGNSTFDTGTTVTGALRLVATRHEMQKSASLVRQDLTWEIPTVQVGDFANPVGPNGTTDPKVNDVIQDAAGVRWSVTRVECATLQTRWHITTVQERT